MKEAYPRFQEAGANLVAISNDSLASHHDFAEKLGGLPYPLLSDERNEAINAYDVLNDAQTGARRSIFVVDRGGEIAYVNPAYDVRRPDHLEEIFEQLAKLR